MKTKDDGLQGFIGIFEVRLERMKKKIEGELSKPKKERSKHVLKRLIQEASGLKKTIKKFKKAARKCPHCGEEIE
ncbi:MAG: hypothetical protein E4H14_05005 [Candidatus Thorarchaeota archaeon]|nr:MAG: hypothetical protein E4H14_05005 [Candidatus Thorarchaeota archaeon]